MQALTFLDVGGARVSESNSTLFVSNASLVLFYTTP